jgi:hypothetical protein
VKLWLFLSFISSL